MNPSAARLTFYVPGGTLPRDAPSYVIRDADLDLHAALARGELCSVLTPRQMGKSSLMVRAVVRLREENAKAVVIDLAAFGENVTPEQWYFAMLGRIGSQLNLEDELEAYWYARNSQGPLQRWLGAIREVVLVHVQAPVFLFIDDVDATRSLPFAAGEFFTGIRQLYDERAESASLSRLNFCLLGAATPAELVRDARLTPFKVGRLIELTDFTEKEAQVLLPGLRRAGRYAPELLRRVLYWTGGHPYLTQCLCEALVADGRVRKSTGVDRVCQETFLSAQARERDDNLLFVRDRMLRGGANAVELLTLYSTIRAGRIVKDDPAQPVLKELRLAGVVRVDNGYLRVRNRIYERVFDQKFIESNQPLDEAARQRVAERRGRLKALAWAVPLMLALAALAAGAWWQSRRAWTETDQLTAAANTGMRVLSNIADRVYDASANRPELHAIYAQILDGGTPFVDTMLRMDADNPAANNLKAGSLYLAIDDALRKGDKAAARSQSQECTARASALLGHSDPRLRAIAARLYATAAEAFAKLGDSSEAEANVKRAEATVQDVSRQTKPGDEFALQSISTTYNTLGAAEEALDRWDRAAQFYQHNAGSEQKLSDLYSKHGGDPKLFQEVHDALEERNRSAQIELDNHHYKEARKALEERSLSIAQTLVSWNNDPARQRTAAQKLDALRDRFDVEIKLGSLLALRSEDWAAALKYDLQALSDAQNLVQATPNLPSLQLREEAALAAARMYKLLGQDREASETYTRYIAWLRQRALAQPGSEVAAKLGFAYQEFGSFEAHHGNKSSAPADYLNALEWLSKISSTDGSVEREIASAYLKLAAVESDFGQAGPAHETYVKAVHAAEKCIAFDQKSSASPDSTAVLMSDYQNLAFSKAGIGDLKGSAAAIGKLLDVARAAAAAAQTGLSQKKTPEAIARAVFADGTLGWAELLSNHPQESIRASRSALLLDGQQPWIQANLAHAYILAGQVDQASSIYLAHAGEQMYDDRLAISVLDDFAELRKIGLNPPAFAQMEKLLAH